MIQTVTITRGHKGYYRVTVVSTDGTTSQAQVLGLQDALDRAGYYINLHTNMDMPMTKAQRLEIVKKRSE